MSDSSGSTSSAQPVARVAAGAAPRLSVRAAQSSLWSLMGQIFQAVLGLASFAVLSRWLTPADYGILGMAMTVSGVLGVVGDSGITAAVTRLPEIDAETEATAFWLSFVGAAVLTLIVGATAPLLAIFYKKSAVTGVTVVLAFGFLLSAPMRVSSAKLARALRFRETTIIGMVANVVAVATAAVLAARGFGVWALVAQTIVTISLTCLMTVSVARPQISLSLWSRGRARELARFGSHMSGFSLATVAGRSLDTVLAGRFIGSSALGLMSMGMKLVYQPVERLCGAIYSVFLPATVELGALERQAKAFQSAVRLLSIAVAPFCFGAVAVAPEIIRFLPDRWSALTPVLRLYALTSLLMPIGYLSMSVLVAQGRGRALFRMGLALIPVSWAAALLGALSRSVMGMVAAWSFSVASGGIILLWLIWSSLSLGLTFVAAAGVPVVVSGAMAAVVRLALAALGLGGTRPGLAVGVAVGALTYGLGSWLTMRADLLRAWRLTRDAINRRAARGSSI